MTTQQETLRYFIDLVEAVEQGNKRPVDPAVEKFNKKMAELAESQLDEVNWKKAAAVGAIGLSALFANLAHAAPGLIDTTNNATAAQSCQTILMQASMVNGLNLQAKNMATQGAQQFQQIANNEFQKLINRGDMRGAQVSQSAANKTQQKINNLSPQERTNAILGAADSCIGALR